MSLQTGDTLLKGQYRILDLIGQGGFAFVYHARDTLLGRDVAIKELVPSAVSDPKWLKRFFVEARATLELRNDHIVATYTLFAESGNRYLVIEYMPDGSMEDALQKKYRLPLDEAVRIAREVCEGLSYAHRRGIVHCDLKPANILFAADGTAKVADFGIAHVSSHGARSRHWATTGPFVAGTLEYMSPEQVEGERSDPRIDLYALGALLYHALTGRPYADFGDSGTLADIGHNLDLIRHHQPAPPSSHNSLVPPWLDDLVLRLLAKRPEDRPGTASEVLALLGPPVPAAQGPPIPPAPPAGPSLSLMQQHLPTWTRNVALGVLLVVLLGIALKSLFGSWGPVPATPPPTVTVPTSTASAAPTPTPTPMSTHTPTSTRTPTSEPPILSDGGRSAFASGAAGNLQICVMNVNDRRPTCLTDNGSLNESPAWSPDGKRLAFHSTQDGNFEVYGMNADGTEQKNLTNQGLPDGSPSWSPDGRRIAFDSGRDGNGEIYVMDADGSGPTNLTNHPAWDSQPAWSPDGSRLAFMSDRDGNLEIYLMNADGSALTWLTDHPEDDKSPAWSPDGKLIVFFSNRDGPTTDIYVMNADGSGVRRLTNHPANDGSPCWSPDGERIAFDSDRDGNWEIYVMNADGSEQVNLTESPDEQDHFPAWGQ
jgi:Tol biopolymer transport system component/tRNA A-37 threonylcarbamoyl transferase component Bud32